MTVVALASAKGSPGVTTTAMALASCWSRSVIVLEADPAGGDIAARLGVPEDPGLVGLAAALRRQGRADALAHYSQESPLGITVVPAPAGAQQSAAAVGVLAALPDAQLPDDVDVLLDVGRLERASPAWAMSEAADLLIWVSRPQLADLAHLSAALERRRGYRQDRILLCGSGPYGGDEVATALGVTTCGHLPSDPDGVAALWAAKSRLWARCAIGRAARDVARDVEAVLAPRRPPSGDDVGVGGPGSRPDEGSDPRAAPNAAMAGIPGRHP